MELDANIDYIELHRNIIETIQRKQTRNTCSGYWSWMCNWSQRISHLCESCRCWSTNAQPYTTWLSKISLSIAVDCLYMTMKFFGVNKRPCEKAVTSISSSCVICLMEVLDSLWLATLIYLCFTIHWLIKYSQF